MKGNEITAVNIQIPFTQEEFKDVKEAADKLGMDISQFVRTVVTHELLDRKLRCYSSSGIKS
jgi:hypothetical protein